MVKGNTPGISPVTCSMIRRASSLTRNNQPSLTVGVIAVSYTHLGVYKRQALQYVKIQQLANDLVLQEYDVEEIVRQLSLIHIYYLRDRRYHSRYRGFE